MSALLAFFAGPVGRWIVVALMVLAFGATCAVKGAGFEQRKGAAALQKLQGQWDAERVAQAKVVQVQRDRNVEIQRAAEKNYVVTLDKQGSFFAAAAKEIHDAPPLADCRVPDVVRVRLNAAAACARGDSPAACGPAGKVPDAGGPS